MICMHACMLAYVTKAMTSASAFGKSLNTSKSIRTTQIVFTFFQNTFLDSRFKIQESEKIFYGNLESFSLKYFNLESSIQW